MAREGGKMTGSKDLKRGAGLGLAAGVAWGLLASLINALTGVFPFEQGVLHTMITFAAGGGVFGIVAGGFMALVHDRLPTRSPYAKAVLLTTCIWLILRAGAGALSWMNPLRYHAVPSETIQGFLLVVLMGLILGAVWSLGVRGVARAR